MTVRQVSWFAHFQAASDRNRPRVESLLRAAYSVVFVHITSAFPVNSRNALDAHDVGITFTRNPPSRFVEFAVAIDLGVQ